jgi:sodium-dependent dicarboxylate transporter 2/3/5
MGGGTAAGKKQASTVSRLAAILFAVAVLVIVMAAPLPVSMATIHGAALTVQGRAALAALAFALTLWIAEALPFHITGLLAILVTMLLRAGDYADIVRYGFGDDIVVFFIGVLVIAACLRRSGLAKRAGSVVLAMTGNSTRAIIFGFLAAGAFLAMWITALGSVAIIMPLALEVLDEEGEKPGKSRFGKALMIASAWGPLIGALGTPAGSGSNPIAIRFMSEIAGYEISFLGWMAYGVPAALVLLPVAWIIILAFFPPERKHLAKSVEAIHTEARKRAPFTRDEKSVGIVFLSTIAIWMLSPAISQVLGMKVPISIGALIATVTIFIPGVSSYKWKDLEKDIDWSGILLIATGISLGTTLYKTGAAAWVAAGVLGGIGSLPTFWRIAAVAFGVFAIKVVFSSNTLTGTIIVPLVLALGTSLGLDARGLALAAALTANLAVILVTTSPVNVVPYTTGYFTIRDMAKAGLALAVVAAFAIAAVVTVLGGAAGIV